MYTPVHLSCTILKFGAMGCKLHGHISMMHGTMFIEITSSNDSGIILSRQRTTSHIYANNKVTPA